MSDVAPVQVLRRSPGRLRLHAPALSGDGRAGLTSIAGAEGILLVQLNDRTGNLLIEFDRSVIDEPDVLALVMVGAAPRRPARPRRKTVDRHAPVRAGWRRAARAETIHAPPVACVAALIDFELYPRWQTYVTDATVLERDEHGRGVRVSTRAQVGEREIQFTTSYRYPSSHRIAFEQDDGELEAVEGSWTFRSLGRGRTRATYVVEVKIGWRLNLVLQGPRYEQIREAVLDHVMSELRERVESRRDLAQGMASADIGLCRPRAAFTIHERPGTNLPST
jgi:ribosome-associated toxin RatA of RatAB toxin-antitoxin module